MGSTSNGCNSLKPVDRIWGRNFLLSNYINTRLEGDQRKWPINKLFVKIVKIIIIIIILIIHLAAWGKARETD